MHESYPDSSYNASEGPGKLRNHSGCESQYGQEAGEEDDHEVDADDHGDGEDNCGGRGLRPVLLVPGSRQGRL